MKAFSSARNFTSFEITRNFTNKLKLNFFPRSFGSFSSDAEQLCTFRALCALQFKIIHEFTLQNILKFSSLCEEASLEFTTIHKFNLKLFEIFAFCSMQ